MATLSSGNMKFYDKEQEILNRVSDPALTHSILKKYFTLNVSITDEAVTTQS